MCYDNNVFHPCVEFNEVHGIFHSGGDRITIDGSWYFYEITDHLNSIVSGLHAHVTHSSDEQRKKYLVNLKKKEIDEIISTLENIKKKIRDIEREESKMAEYTEIACSSKWGECRHPSIVGIAYILYHDPDREKKCCHCDHCAKFWDVVRNGLDEECDHKLLSDDSIFVEMVHSHIKLLKSSDAKLMKDFFKDKGMRKSFCDIKDHPEDVHMEHRV